jgi:DNA-binding NarL/FixJ family response regulator
MSRILVVDDHPLMRKGLALTLEAESDMEVVAQAADAEEAMSIVEKQEVDVAVVDISLPGMSGLELIKHLQALRPGIKVLVVSRHDETLYAERAIRAGARGYVMKLEASDLIVGAVRRVMAGGIYVSAEINERMLQTMAGGRADLGRSPLEVLSDRELEVFELIGRGHPNREIAERLHLSVKTVESYRTRIKEKLGLKTAAEVMQHAFQWIGSEGTG